MEPKSDNVILENQAQIDTLIMKKIKLTKEQLRKLEIMIPYYYNDINRTQASSKIIGKALEYYFQNKYVEDIKQL